MKIALPVAQGKLCLHFGHCQGFLILEVNKQEKKIIGQEYVPAPEHQPGLLPRFLAEKGVNLIITGGMGRRAQNFFQEYGIEVMLGAPADDPAEIVKAWLEDRLELGENICDH